MKKLLVLLVLLLIPTVMALETTQKCLNSTHLETITKWTQCDTTCEDNNITQVINCTHGCDSIDEDCKIAPYKVNLYVVGGIFILIIGLAVALKR